jgi:hypothetical protein
MADRLNDTDPQSPRALGSKTDPGLGSEPALLPPRPPPRVGQLAAPSSTPPPTATASIEEVLDGITGPRPPPSSRREGADGDRAYVSARPAPRPRSMPPPEPLVVSPDPPHYEVAGRDHRDGDPAPRRPDPSSTRPVVRKSEERTVLTGRRALIRNLGVAVASSVVVGLMMMTIMRWKETHRPRRASAVVVLPPVPELETVAPPATIPPPPAATIVGGVVPVIPSSAPAPSLAPTVAASKGPGPAGKRGKGEAKTAPPAASGLDDLNREIRH